MDYVVIHFRLTLKIAGYHSANWGCSVCLGTGLLVSVMRKKRRAEKRQKVSRASSFIYKEIRITWKSYSFDIMALRIKFIT